jgi:hypothetical protein
VPKSVGDSGGGVEDGRRIMNIELQVKSTFQFKQSVFLQSEVEV